MTTIRNVLLILSALCLLACGGLLNSDASANALGTVTLQSIAPTDANNGTLPTSPGRTVRATVQHYVPSNLYGQPVLIRFLLGPETPEGSTEPIELSVTHVTAPDSRPVVQTYDLEIPTTVDYGTYSLIVEQYGRGDGQALSSQMRLTVAKEGALIRPLGTIQGIRGAVVRKSISVYPYGGFFGSVSLTTNLSGATLLPSTVTFPSGSTAAQTVEFAYPVPSDAPGTSTRFTINGVIDGETFINEEGYIGYDPIPVDFTVSASPARINIVGAQVQGATTFTITPTNGFRGTVNVSVALPGNGSLRVSAPTNPFTVVIDSDTPATRTIQYQYQQVNGGTAPIGTATITATSGAKSHSATFEFSAS